MHAVIAAMCRSRAPRVVYQADFTARSPGGGSVASDGLLFTRPSSGYTVQDSESSLISTGTLLSNDVPRFGRALAANEVGLVIEHAVENIVQNNRRLDIATNQTGIAPTLVGLTPDGDNPALGYRTSLASGEVSYFPTFTLALTTYVMSIWCRNYSGSGPSQFYFVPQGTPGVVVGTLDTTWRRVFAPVVVGTAGLGYMIPVDGRDLIAQNIPTVAGARDTVVDFMSVTQGRYPLEEVVTTVATTRAGERLYHPAVENLLAAGTLTVEIDLRPKGAADLYAGTPYVLGRDANNRLTYDPTTQRFTARIGGVDWTPSQRAWWDGDARIKILARLGGGLPRRLFVTNANGGAIDFGEGPTDAALGWTGDLDLLCNGTASQLTSRVARIRTYA